VKGILADVNIEGHVRFLNRLMQTPSRAEIWTHLNLAVRFFPELGMDRTTPDRAVWQRCQQDGLVLITANRNEEGEESLEATVRALNTAASLPVFTLGDPDRVVADREYADRVADRILEYLFDIDMYRGTGRLFVP
jgi:hypothetical protein